MKTIFTDFMFSLFDIPLFKFFMRFLIKIFKTKDILINVHGHKMYAHTIDRIVAILLWKYNILEDFEKKILKDIIKKEMIVLDIGANIGFYTLQFAKLVGEKGKVFAFEPEPDNFSLLVKNIKSNNYKNIISVQKAVSNKTGIGNLFFCEEHRGDHRIFDSKDGRKSIKIETIALDDFFSKKDRIDIIKMDIEGAEYLAFNGMEKIIKRNKKLIIILEFIPYLIKKCGDSPERFINKIKEYGFEIYLINEKKKCLEQITENGLNKICGNEKDFMNLYLKK